MKASWQWSIYRGSPRQDDPALDLPTASHCNVDHFSGVLVDAWRSCNDTRILATSAAEAGEAPLPQLVRTKFTTSATSLSESRQAKLGIVNCAGVRAVRGVCDPSRTMVTSDRGFPA